jgi:phosphoglycerate dehydrogenase-like enzyme
VNAVVLAMAPDLPSKLFPPPIAARLGETGPVLTEFTSDAARAQLAGARVLLTGWGCPMIGDDVLAAAPRLEAVVHAAGTVKTHVGPAVFARGITVSSAAAANAVPVAEYTLAMILLANKAVPMLAAAYRARRGALDLRAGFPDIGNFGKTVGVLGASKIGRRLIELLKPFDLDVLVADPYVDKSTADELGVRLVGIDELFAAGDVVSIHAPAVPATDGLVTARLLASMRTGATLINTARGSLVDTGALIAELRRGRISAVLDVTEPEVTEPRSPLWELPNVQLTPHVAGAMGNELARLGAAAADEVRRVLTGAPLRHAVDPATLSVTA